MIRPGGITLRLPADTNGTVQLTYRGPGDVTALLKATPVERVPALVRRLFAVCAEAQGHAAALAIEAARGITAPSGALAAREIKGWVEIVREHGLRLCLDWACLLGEAPDHGSARAFMALAGGAGTPSELIETTVTGMAPESWLAMDSATDLAWWARAGRTAAARFIALLLDMPALAANDEVEPGGLAARHADHPLLARALPSGSLIARHVARLIDLCRAPARMAALAAGIATPVRGITVAPGRGVAQVPCSRGTLSHEVGLADGGIGHYHILSPTERAFTPGGSAERQVRRLDALPAPDRRRLAEVMMQALDPCVDYTVEGA